MKTFGNVFAFIGFMCLLAEVVTPIGAVILMPFILLFIVFAKEIEDFANGRTTNTAIDPKTGYRRRVYHTDPVAHERIYTEYGKSLQRQT
jgi:hypothetical protein